MTAVLPEALLAAGAVCGEASPCERGETVATGEGSCGGTDIYEALLAVPGASAYFLGGSVIYTRHALDGLLTGRGRTPAETARRI